MCFFSFDFWKKVFVFFLFLCGVGKNWDFLKNKSDVLIFVRGIFKKSGSVVKDLFLFVGFLFLKFFECLVLVGGWDWGENIFCLVLCDFIV